VTVTEQGRNVDVQVDFLFASYTSITTYFCDAEQSSVVSIIYSQSTRPIFISNVVRRRLEERRLVTDSITIRYSSSSDSFEPGVPWGRRSY